MYDENAQACRMYNDIADSKGDGIDDIAYYDFYRE